MIHETNVNPRISLCLVNYFWQMISLYPGPTREGRQAAPYSLHPEIYSQTERVAVIRSPAALPSLTPLSFGKMSLFLNAFYKEMQR